VKLLESLKRKARTFRDDPPGKRFQERYRRHRASRTRTVFKVLMFLGGLALLVIGLFFMLVPGPGIPIAAAGAALIANESLLVARALDAIELKLRKMFHAL
jgi:hypothetical protein